MKVKFLKGFFKWIFMVVGALVILIIIIAVASSGGSSQPEQHQATSGNETQAETQDNASSKATDKSDGEKQKEEDTAKVTREEYEKVETGDTLTGEGGMKIKKVKKILGEPQNVSETTSGDMTMKTMMWDAEGDFGATVSVSFTNGKASGKSSFGLEK